MQRSPPAAHQFLAKPRGKVTQEQPPMPERHLVFKDILHTKHLQCSATQK